METRYQKHFELLRIQAEELLEKKPLESGYSHSKEEFLKLIQKLEVSQLELELQNAELIKARIKAEENDRLKSAFLANMSHEIRTPLNGILGFTELLKKPMLEGEKREKYINIIEKNGQHLLTIINSIISISKVEAGQMQISLSETNLNEQLEYVYIFFNPEAAKNGLHLSYKKGLKDYEAIIQTDRDKIYAVLINLVKNAIKFTKEGAIEFGYKKKGNYLEFYVKDTGPGISKDLLEIIFDRFRQGNESQNRNYEGAGLGLSISKAYIEVLGGQIWVESEFGKGSTFHFTIPVKSSGKDERINKKQAKVYEKNLLPDRGLNILIAEDDEASEILLREAIKKYSKDIISVKSGIEAIEACRFNSNIDLVLMDIQMPKMNGHEAVRQIRQFNREVVIVAQTALGFDDDKEEAINAGCNDYISKPFDKTSLSRLLKKHFYTEINI